jgi:hypothetical protein
MKQDILEGVRVVEVASWSFVPSSGATLADWGADVIRIEHPVTGDPQRGLVSSGMVTAAGSVNHFIEQPNRGKRSLGLDIASDAGREVLRKLVEQSDVFVTNLLPASRARAGIDVEDVRVWNPKVIYARGNGYGPRGEQAGRGGFDLAAYWARGGIGDSLITRDGEWPAPQRPAFGDVFGGFALAAGIVAALFANAAVRFQNRRECIAILRATFEAQPPPGSGPGLPQLVTRRLGRQAPGQVGAVLGRARLRHRDNRRGQRRSQCDGRGQHRAVPRGSEHRRTGGHPGRGRPLVEPTARRHRGDAAGVSIERAASMDATRPLGTLTLRDVTGTVLATSTSTCGGRSRWPPCSGARRRIIAASTQRNTCRAPRRRWRCPTPVRPPNSLAICRT